MPGSLRRRGTSGLWKGMGPYGSVDPAASGSHRAAPPRALASHRSGPRKTRGCQPGGLTGMIRVERRPGTSSLGPGTGLLESRSGLSATLELRLIGSSGLGTGLRRRLRFG